MNPYYSTVPGEMLPESTPAVIVVVNRNGDVVGEYSSCMGENDRSISSARPRSQALYGILQHCLHYKIQALEMPPTFYITLPEGCDVYECKQIFDDTGSGLSNTWRQSTVTVNFGLDQNLKPEEVGEHPDSVAVQLERVFSSTKRHQRALQWIRDYQDASVAGITTGSENQLEDPRVKMICDEVRNHWKGRTHWGAATELKQLEEDEALARTVAQQPGMELDPGRPDWENTHPPVYLQGTGAGWGEENSYGAQESTGEDNRDSTSTQNGHSSPDMPNGLTKEAIEMIRQFHGFRGRQLRERLGEEIYSSFKKTILLGDDDVHDSINQGTIKWYATSIIDEGDTAVVRRYEQAKQQLAGIEARDEQIAAAAQAMSGDQPKSIRRKRYVIRMWGDPQDNVRELSEASDRVFPDERKTEQQFEGDGGRTISDKAGVIDSVEEGTSSAEEVICVPQTSPRKRTQRSESRSPESQSPKKRPMTARDLRGRGSGRGRGRGG